MVRAGVQVRAVVRVVVRVIVRPLERINHSNNRKYPYKNIHFTLKVGIYNAGTATVVLGLL